MEKVGLYHCLRRIDNDKWEGCGIYLCKGGKKHVGEWKNCDKYGKGIMYSPEVTVECEDEYSKNTPKKYLKEKSSLFEELDQPFFISSRLSII